MFNTSTLKDQKEVAIQEVKRSLSMPEKAIGRLSRQILYPKQRMGKLNTGSIEEIQRHTLQNLQKFHDRVYFPNNFVLVISGGVNETDAFKYAQKYFGDLISGEDAPNLSHKQNNNLEVQCVNDSSYTKTYAKISYYGKSLNDDSDYDIAILSAILNTYLQNLIKNTLGIAYKSSCENYSSGSYSLVSFYFACDDKHVEKIIKEINRMVEIIPKLLSVRNVENIKKQIVAKRIFDFEKTSLRADYYSTILLHGRLEQNHEYEMSKIKNAKVSDIKKIAAEIFSQKPKITVLSKGLSEKDIKSFLE